MSCISFFSPLVCVINDSYVQNGRMSASLFTRPFFSHQPLSFSATVFSVFFRHFSMQDLSVSLIIGVDCFQYILLVQIFNLTYKCALCALLSYFLNILLDRLTSPLTWSSAQCYSLSSRCYGRFVHPHFPSSYTL